MQTCSVVEPDPPPTPPEVSDPGRPADWMLAGLLLALVVFEVWALWRHKNTISQRLQHLSKARRWLRWVVGVVGFAVLSWHLFWGFPW